MTYFIWWLIGITVIFAILFLEGVFIGLTTYSNPLSEDQINTIAGVSFYVMYIPIAFFVTTRRLHDLGRSNWHFLTLFIPIYSIIVSLELLFKAPENGANAYGLEYEGVNLGRLFTSTRSELEGVPDRAVKAHASLSNTDELMKYAEMYKEGLITEEEWYAKKKKLL